MTTTQTDFSSWYNERILVEGEPRVKIIGGGQGTLVYTTRGGWLGVRSEGGRVDEYRRAQIMAVRS